MESSASSSKLPSHVAFKTPLVFHEASGTVDCQAAVIWLHGFGDRAEGWASALKPLRALESTKLWKWIHMRAPLVEQPAYGNKRLPAWGQFFDEKCIHVGSRDYDDHDASSWYSASVDAVKHQVQILEEDGIPKERIVIGGFSQGAALALEAVLSMTTPVGGCIVLSGWMTPRSKAALSSKRGAGAPVLLCHGTMDDMVGFDCAEATASTLKSVGWNLQFEQYKGLEHSSCPQELTVVAKFLHERLSPGVLVPNVDWDDSDSQSEDSSDDGLQKLFMCKNSLESFLRRLQEGQVLTQDSLGTLTDEEASSNDDIMVPMFVGSVKDVIKLLNELRAEEASKMFIECANVALSAADTHITLAEMQEMLQEDEEEELLEQSDSCSEDREEGDCVTRGREVGGAPVKRARTKQ